MKLQKFKEKDNKRIGVIVFTIICILLVSCVILYRTFAIFEVKTSQNVIKGTVQDPGNIYFAFYVNDGKENKIQKEMPTKNYVLDEEQSYCGVNGEKDDNIKVTLTDEYGIYVTGVTTSRTKCNLYFVSDAFILGKPIKAITSGDGLYEVTHEDVSGTINNDGFKETEFRYAGSNPNNYLTFNDETWRIIGLVNVMTDEKTVEQRVKIVKNDVIKNDNGENSKVYWNEEEEHLHDWTKASLQVLLNNGDYYSSSNEYSKAGLKDAKFMIETVTWNIGANQSYGDTTTKEFYEHERSTLTDTNSYTWQGKIGLIYPSDYGFATSGENNENRKDCLNKFLYKNWNDSNCYDYDWLKVVDTWTLMPCLGHPFQLCTLMI